MIDEGKLWKDNDSRFSNEFSKKDFKNLAMDSEQPFTMERDAGGKDKNWRITDNVYRNECL